MASSINLNINVSDIADKMKQKILKETQMLDEIK